MQTSATLPFVTPSGRQLQATASAYLMAQDEPVCVIHSIEFQSTDSGPLEPLMLTESDLYNIELYLWQQFNTLCGMDLVVPDGAGGFVIAEDDDECMDCGDCACSNSSLH